MKKILLCGSALVGCALTSAAFAEEPIRLTVGGHFKEAYMIVSDDDDLGQLGHDRNTDGFFNDAEIDFTGSTDLDNGLEVGAHIELEGETDGDQIDEAYVWFAGGFGEIRVGSDDEALHKACVAPPGGSSNFSAFSPNQWGANAGLLLEDFGARFSDNPVCLGVDETRDAQKIIYTSPVFGGFQLTASYTPNSDDQTHDDGVGPHLGMPVTTLGDSRHNFSAAVNYGYDGGDWGLETSLGGSWQGKKEDDAGDVGELSFKEQSNYQAGINLYFGNFAIGVAGEYFNNIDKLTFNGVSQDHDAWVIGGGAAYTYDAWTFGVQYSHHEEEFDFENEGEFNMTQDRAIGTVSYLLGPGINLDASLAYTWIDSDPETVIGPVEQDVDDYDAFEIGLGATVTF